MAMLIRDLTSTLSKAQIQTYFAKVRGVTKEHRIFYQKTQRMHICGTQMNVL